MTEFFELFEIYENRFSEPVEPPIPIWMLADAPPFQKPKRAELGARRSIVEAIDGIWRECGGQGRGSYYHVVKERFDGPLLALLETLFVAVSGSDAPSSATLHHDLAFIATGRERRR